MGYRPTREYYINDAGRQMEILAVSTWLRYLELRRTFAFPANGYAATTSSPIAELVCQGRPRAALMRPRHGVQGICRPTNRRAATRTRTSSPHRPARGADRRRGLSPVLDLALSGILADIREDLAEFGVRFDSWFSERSLTEDGSIAAPSTRSKTAGHAYRKDGALWFKSTDFGDEKDRVMVRENGIKTYFASRHRLRFQQARARLRAPALHLGRRSPWLHRAPARGSGALGGPADCFEVRLVQFVTLFRGGEKAQMSTRSGDFVTLRDLRGEVGNDAARLFYVMRSNDQHLDFDLELAKARSNDNPVYYIQYAHARVASVMRQLEDRGFVHDAAQRPRFACRPCTSRRNCS